jgi:Reverse transcriptase (RNA-dependent DNA polymerase)
VIGHKSQAKYWKSMKRAFLAMESKGVWKINQMSSMPHGSNIVGSRWACNANDDGTYKSRAVAQGFSQVPEKDFTDSHDPVFRTRWRNLHESSVGYVKNIS